MATLADLTSAISNLSASVDALPARVEAAVAAATAGQDTQPLIDEVNALKTKVDAVSPAAQ